MRADFSVGAGYDFAKKRFLGMCGNSDAVMADGEKVFDAIKGQIDMKAVYREVLGGINNGKIRLSEVEISAPILSSVDGIRKIYLYALTAGDIKSDKGVLHSTLADMWGTAFNDACCMLLKEKLQSENKGLFVSEPFGPGFYGISAEEVENIFKVIDYKEIGLTLKNGFITPAKSSTGFFVVSEKHLNFFDCKSCAGDTNCVYCRNYKGSVTVKFENEKKSVEVKAGTTVLAAAQKAGVTIETPCGGMGKCKKCMVDISDAGGVREVMACNEKISADCSVFTQDRNDEISVSIISDKRGIKYSAALDLGTTTIEISILSDDDAVCRVNSQNPQTVYSQDIMGRINFPEYSILKRVVTARINEMLNSAIERLGIKPSDIHFMSVSGNTVMQYLLIGYDPKELGRYPYTVSADKNLEFDAEELGAEIQGKVRFMPYISAFVGGDTASGILSQRLWENENTLLIDIGTNAEMAVYRQGTLYVTSAAAGPAFEGMNITFGMRAEDGAVSEFRIVNNAVSVSTIGKSRAKGICGSGLAEIISELLRIGAIEPDGSFKDKRIFLSPLRPRLCEYNGEATFCVCNEVYLTQSDIRAFQLAKGAIRAGVEIMSEGVDKVIISGAFGEHIDKDSLIKTGILPKRFKGKIDTAGNTSLRGAELVCKDKQNIERILDVTKNAVSVNLADNEEFKELFIRHINFLED